jgi:hypothetical protein
VVGSTIDTSPTSAQRQMAEENVDAILGQDLQNLDSFSDENMKLFIDMILRFIIDTKV